jgi:cytochrome c
MAKFMFGKVRMTIGLVVIGLFVAACNNLQQSKAGGGMEANSIDNMIAGAMKNMEKIMMMPPEEQGKYVMNTQQASLAHGKELFSSAKIGSNGFTCATCHPSGKTTGGKVPMGKMEMAIPTLEGVAATFPKFKVPNNAVITLQEMNNNCVVMFLKGQPLPLGGQEARDLDYYLSTLSNNKPFTPGKQSMM